MRSCDLLHNSLASMDGQSASVGAGNTGPASNNAMTVIRCRRSGERRHRGLQQKYRLLTLKLTDFRCLEFERYHIEAPDSIRETQPSHQWKERLATSSQERREQGRLAPSGGRFFALWFVRICVEQMHHITMVNAGFSTSLRYGRNDKFVVVLSHHYHHCGCPIHAALR